MFPENSSKTLPSGVTIERLPTFRNHLFFRVFMPEGSKIEANTHDCYEDVIMYSGNIVELSTAIELVELEHLTIKPMHKHAFFAKKESVMYAYLYKPTPNR